MSVKDINQLTDVLSAPLGDLIAEIGHGVASAQYAMDKQSLALLESIYEKDEAYLDQLRAMGYRPNWYQIPEAEAEIQLSLAITGSYTKENNGKLKMFAAPMNASYKNSFDYELSASSKLKMHIVPVPEPSYLEQQMIVPLLAGKTLDDAKHLLEQLDIPFEVDEDAEGSATVEASEPAAGEMLKPGSVVNMTLEN